MKRYYNQIRSYIINYLAPVKALPLGGWLLSPLVGLIVVMTLSSSMVHSSEREAIVQNQKKILLVDKRDKPPFLDGMAIDKCWGKSLPIKFHDDIRNKKDQILVKACHDGDKIYFLIQYPTTKEKRKHKSWEWNPISNSYISKEKEEEETFTIIVAKSQEKNRKADIYIWRAGRTDPVNRADDLFFNNDKIEMDSGKCTWFSKYFGNYSGKSLPRFYNRNSTGSVADINAKGCWDKSNLTIEFSRKMKTNHNDDVELNKGIFYIKVLRGTPKANDINKYTFTPMVIQ